jgi:hypothetical protein
VKRHFVPLDERVLGPNPFPRGDTRHARWRDACRSAAEDQSASLAQTVRRLEVCPEDQLSFELVNGLAAAFDIRARYLAALMVQSYDDLPAYEHALPRLVDAVVALARELCPSFLQKAQFVDQVRIRLTSHAAHWQHQVITLAREAESQNAAATPTDDGGNSASCCNSWQDVTIEFLSDHRVQITVPGGTYNENFAEIGFKNRKTGLPNSAWEMLRTIAEGDGRISTSHIPWKKVEKRVQEIRRALRAYFQHRKITTPNTDPMPFVKGQGYVAAVRLALSPSYDS